MSSKLTEKQRCFANNILAGMTPSAAYSDAYEAGSMKQASIATEASKLMKHPKIAPIIEEGRKEALANTVWSRCVAISRLEEINAAAYREVMENGFTERKAVSAFFDSLDRLNKITEEAAPKSNVYSDDDWLNVLSNFAGI